MTSTRQLAAIMFTDIVGYTVLMGKDSGKALELVRVSKEIQKPLVEQHNGTWLKEMGDGAMALFGSALDAVNCAIKIQEQARAKLDGKLRIGIHLGDITIENKDIYGDGVNMASRLESICEPGAIFISQSIQKSIKGYSIATEDLGNQRLKNVEEPMRVFAVQGVGLPQSKKTVSKNFGLGIQSLKFMVLIILLMGSSIAIYLNFGNHKTDSPIAEIHDRSLAVMPFSNRSKNEEDLPFTEGIQDEIRSRLAKISGLRVLPRSSVQVYKTNHKGPRVIGGELGVVYLLEGGVQRAQNFIRITIELIDVKSERQIWSESYDASLTPSNILNVQTEIASKIASYLGAVISDEEMRRIAKSSTDNFQAYDYYLRAFELSNLMVETTQENMEIAIKFYEKAIALDPNFALAYAMLSDIHSWHVLRGWDRSDQRKKAAKINAEKSVSLEPELSEAHYAMATYYYRVEKDYTKALGSIRLAENGLRGEGFVQLLKGYIHRRAGQWDLALQALDLACNLDPRSDVPYMQIGLTYLRSHQYEEAEHSFKKALELSTPERLIWNQFRMKSVNLYKNADTEDLRSFFRTLDDNVLVYNKWFIEFIDRNYEEALSVLDKSSNLYVANDQEYIIPKSLCRGWTFTAMKNHNHSIDAYQNTINELTDLQSQIGDDYRIIRSLGLAYAGLKKNEQALEFGNKAMKLLSVKKDAMWGMFNVEALAIIYIQGGDFDRATREIEKLVNAPSSVPFVTIAKDPRYDPIRNHPEFIDILNKLKYTNPLLDQKEDH